MKSKKTIWTIVIIVVLVVLGIYLLSLTGKNRQKIVSNTSSNVSSTTNNGVQPNVPTNETLPPGTVAKVPGGSLVKGEKVVTEEGEPVKNDVAPGAPESPRESHALSESEIPKDAIRIVVTKADGFKPNEFTVKAGDVVTLSLTAGDTHTHVFKFKEASLRGVEITVVGGQTRATVFNAPEKGDYPFSCNVPGHTATGVMHVK